MNYEYIYICMYVCVTFRVTRFLLDCLFLNLQEGYSISLGLCPTKLPVNWDIQLGQLDAYINF